jgi:hypothetical protein
MSAWVVSKDHIDLLVSFGLAAGMEGRYHDALRWHHKGVTRYLNHGTTDAVGQMLVDECVRSVSYRYPGDNVARGELPGPVDAYYTRPYRFEPVRPLPALVVAFKAIHCYDYQSCEHPGWPTSEAHEFCVRLQSRLTSMLDGYDAAPWGYDRERREVKA